MRIILSVFRNGESAKIIAVKDDKEEGFKVFGKNDSYSLSIVQIWHTNWSAGLSFGFLPNNRDEDFFVEFNVTHPFKKFCEDFEASSYNDPKKYSFYTHNCSDAARFALGLVGIELELSRFKFNRLNPGAYIRYPGISTPYEVFFAAKEYKNKLLQVEKPLTDSIYAKLERAKSSLQQTKQQVHPDVEKNVDIIISETDKKMQESLHHADSYLRALMIINAMLIHSIDNVQKARQECAESAGFFQKRLPSQVQWYMMDEYIFSLLALSVCLYFVCKPFEESIASLSLVKQSILGGFLGGFGAGSGAFLVYFLNHKNQKYFIEEKERVQAKVDTDLSKALFDLLRHVDEHSEEHKPVPEYYRRVG